MSGELQRGPDISVMFQIWERVECPGELPSMIWCW